MKDRVKAADWPFFFLFCWEPCSQQIFVLLIAFLFLFFCSYLFFYIADFNTAWCAELHGQPVVTLLIAVWICSLCWSSSGNRLWTTCATLSGVCDWICFRYVCYMLISMIIHDHVMRLLEIEKEFIPVGVYVLLWTELHSISMLCSFLDWFWNFNHF